MKQGSRQKGIPINPSFATTARILGGFKKNNPSGPAARSGLKKSALKKMLQCYYFENIRNFNDPCGDCQVTFLNEFRQQLHP